MDAIYAPLFARTLDWAVNFFQEQPYMLAIHAALVREQPCASATHRPHF